MLYLPETTMEATRLPRRVSKRIQVALYCSISFIAFCAFYQYSASQYGNTKYTQLLDPSSSPLVQLYNNATTSPVVTSPKTSTEVPPEAFPVRSMQGLASSPKSSIPDNNRQDSITDCRSLSNKPKLILLWTSFFGYWGYLPKGPFTYCPSCTNCVVTRDRKRLLESDAIVFHARDIVLFDMPPQRLPHQKWIFYCLESPPYSEFAALGFMKGTFNWTMTYRTDSNIVSQYGVVNKIRGKPKKLDKESLRNVWANKKKSVVWLSSHCPTHGGREDFVAELSKYIDVDVYGDCGTLDCPKDSTSKCLDQFAKDYKFFLAFENTICKNYVTEKFFRTLNYDIVPVVFGGAKYQNLAPPGSYIDALAFKSPKHLAYFLTGVGQDFALYSAYFAWRTEHTLVMHNYKECDLCKLLHDPNAKPSVYDDMVKWWIVGGECWSWHGK